MKKKKISGIFLVIIGIVLAVFFIIKSSGVNHNSESQNKSVVQDTSDIMENIKDYLPEELSSPPEEYSSDQAKKNETYSSEKEDISSFSEEPIAENDGTSYTGILQLQNFPDDVLQLIDNKTDQLQEQLQIYANENGYPTARTAIFSGIVTIDFNQNTVSVDICIDNTDIGTVEVIYYRDRQEFQIYPF